MIDSFELNCFFTIIISNKIQLIIILFLNIILVDIILFLPFNDILLEALLLVLLIVLFIEVILFLD